MDNIFCIMTIYKLVADSSNRSQRERQTDKERQRDRIYLHRNIFFMSIISAGTLSKPYL